MQQSTLSKSLTNAFIDYFSDIKPYHTKILEIIETYNFAEDVKVNFEESKRSSVEYANTPLCRETGFGIEFDDSCGFDAVECCNLFDCDGGYGLIFDNSDMLVDREIWEINHEESWVSVTGNQTRDTTFQIIDYPSSTQVRIEGDVAGFFNVHRLLRVIPYKSYSIVETFEDGVEVSGNRVADFALRPEVRITESSGNDGVYGVESSEFDPNSGNTRVWFAFEHAPDLLAGLSGKLYFRSPSKNNGLYLVDGATQSSGVTTVTIRGDKQFDHLEDDYNGSVQIRTGFVAPRKVWLYDTASDSSREVSIHSSEYDAVSDQTRIYFDQNLSDDITTEEYRIRIHGYEFGAGFDGASECQPNKPSHVNVAMVESLLIEVLTEEIDCFLIMEDESAIELETGDGLLVPEECPDPLPPPPSPSPTSTPIPLTPTQ